MQHLAMMRGSSGGLRVATWLVLAAASLLISGSVSAAQPATTESCGAPIEVLTVTGTAMSIEPSELFDGEDHSVVTLSTDDGDRQVLLFGRPDLLEEGLDYEIRVSQFADIASIETDYAWLHSDDPCGAGSTVRLVTADGTLEDIAKPPLFSIPVSARQYFYGFGVFALVVYLFSRLTT